jgi:hypothetical protein
MSDSLVGGRLAAVIVPRSSTEKKRYFDTMDEELTQAIVDYVNNVMHAGVYARHELPQKAIQAYHADFYRVQVGNGGHSQFIHNCGSEQFPTTVGDGLAGLEAMGAQAQHRILSEMAAWAEANPAEADAQTGFDVRAKVLDDLDTRFCDAEKHSPVTQHAARWIRGWPELLVVDDERYGAEIERLAAMNPFRGPRLVWRSVQNIRHQMTDHLMISVSAACGAVAPEPEAKTAVRGGWHQAIEGRQCMAWIVGTDKGARLCVADEAGARLYEQVKRAAGARLSNVGAGTISGFATMARETRAPEALDLLLRTAKLDPGAAITAWRLHDDGATWIAMTGGRRVVAKITRHGAALVNDDGTPAATFAKAEIDRHAAEVAEAGATLRQPA